ncbi:Lymphocyte antigen 6A-2/6E-1 [Heterocephalus glaber]|uniref:Lymphocyte antigen 6A-2/6E-1 n=1 Tax=Heterocephalus glaber TaxID=10181 RepID=G5AWG4_HETGA|nr:Lymphocyte antigen 6A-2/6E-1 [Heterocephalus glaber]
MKPCALVLLVALLCAETGEGTGGTSRCTAFLGCSWYPRLALGLRCYQCQNYTHTKTCEQVTCSYPGGDGIWVSLEGNFTVESDTVRLENKVCLPVCPKKSDLSMTFGGLTTNFKITCCKKDLCNVGVLVGGSA